jgi:hypothetical protein
MKELSNTANAGFLFIERGLMHVFTTLAIAEAATNTRSSDSKYLFPHQHVYSF